MMTLDVPYIFNAVGGPRALLSVLNLAEPAETLNYPTVGMWRSRGIVSGPWIVPVIYAMTRRGHVLSELLVDSRDPF